MYTPEELREIAKLYPSNKKEEFLNYVGKALLKAAENGEYVTTIAHSIDPKKRETELKFLEDIKFELSDRFVVSEISEQELFVAGIASIFFRFNIDFSER